METDKAMDAFMKELTRVEAHIEELIREHPKDFFEYPAYKHFHIEKERILGSIERLEKTRADLALAEVQENTRADLALAELKEKTRAEQLRLDLERVRVKAPEGSFSVRQTPFSEILKSIKRQPERCGTF
jgi:hypothetical protein